MAVIHTHKPHTVFTRSRWADQWQAVPYLYANNFSFACGPDMSDAALEYRYGRIMRPGTQFFADFTPLSLTDQYVKIVVNGGPTWYGIVIDTADDRNGECQQNGVEIITGTQTFICRGMEYLLHRTPINTSWVKDQNNAVNGETQIGRAIGFNLGAGLPSSADREANRSNALGANGSYIFTQTLQDASEWTAYDILSYLLWYHTPKDIGGAEQIFFTTVFGNAIGILDHYKPALQVDNKSFFQVLNELIDRRRLMGWYVSVVPNPDAVFLNLFTFNRNAIVLPDASVIPPNANQTNWDFDQENTVQQYILATDDTTKFHRVLCKGEPPGSHFTVEMPGGGGNGYLETDWTSAQQTAYNAGATNTIAGAARYAGLQDPLQKHNANQAARAKDSLKKVYRYFRISPTTFTGIIGGSAVWPLDNDPANVLVPISFWWPGMRLQDRTRLRLEHDYENPAAVTNAMKTSSKWEYQRPFAFARGDDDRYFLLDRAGRGELIDSHIEASGRFYSCSLRMQDDAFGLIVDVHGAPQHIIAKNTFTPFDSVDDVDYEPDLDFNYLAATVFAEVDGRVTVQWPLQHLIVGNPDTLKDLVIFIPNARLDYIVPGTVIDIKDDGTKVQSTGGFVRDDTEFMKNVARSAYEWYAQPRKSIQVTIHDLAETRTRGELILATGGANNGDTVNSVVTKCVYDTLSGTATYMTQFAELDVQ